MTASLEHLGYADNIYLLFHRVMDRMGMDLEKDANRVELKVYTKETKFAV